MKRKFTKVLALMESKGGRVSVDDNDLKTLLGDTHYRLAAYMYDIRKLGGRPVRGIREKHSHAVIAYELGTAIPDSTISPTPLSTETAVSIP